MSSFNKPFNVMASLALFGSLLTACGSDSDDNANQDQADVAVMFEYEIVVKNLTNAQPVSPLAIGFHEEGNLWEIGQSASDGLELLAESGDNSALLENTLFTESMSGADVIMPGMSETNTIMVDEENALNLSMVTMLVNTNDAFTGLNAVDISELTVGESISVNTRSYDAGTEENSELMDTIPGPAAGGEGYSDVRDDVDFVALHPGVVSQDDGKTQSVLTQAHRFNNPVLSVMVTRTK